MLQRLIFERIEQRVLVGTIAFLASMALVGWLAINEGGRMASFEVQYTARSIERGAALFAVNCSECHGPNGLGGAGVAPALNSPHLFGHDYLAVYDRELITLEQERNNPATTAERVTEIDARMQELQNERQNVINQINTVVEAKPGGYDPENPSRLDDLAWAGSLRAFVLTTLIHGRPVSANYWPRQMSAWSQTAGGPLRMDQLEDLTTYILNWDRGDNWTLDDLAAVNQFPIKPVDPSTVVASDVQVIVPGLTDANANPEQLDYAAIDAELANYTGDPQNGQTLYNGALGCAGCHLNAAVAPVTEGTWTRVQELRLQDPANAGLTGEQYLEHSILHPNEYLAPGAPTGGSYPGGVMTPNFASRLSYQDLADLVAYLKTQDQPLP
ncbi:MAG: c-type cytochrome [Anaerolineae bacterium]|nr:c-type cytochrome [Anaerolineae bacterium]